MSSVDILNGYVEDVLSGKIPASKQIKQACDRHLWDLERQETDPSFKYFFSSERVESVMSFMSKLVDPSSVDGSTITLQPWHYFVIGSIFGWVTKEVHPKTGRYSRRFDQAELFVARGNGKSFISSGIALYMMMFDGQPKAEVFSVATQMSQAKIVFGTTCDFAMRSGLGNMVKVTRDDLRCPGMGSVFRPLASDAKRLDGLRPHCAIIDEIHEHPTDKVYNVMKSALGKTSQPLLMIISTAGDRLDGIAVRVWKLGEQILNTIRTDEYNPADDSFFAALYCVDKDDDIFDPSVWIKANPTLGAIKPYEVIERDVSAVQKDPKTISNFKTKHLNLFCENSAVWLDWEKVKSAHDKTLDLNNYRGRECFIGMDLASKLDMSALSLLFPNEDGSVDIFTKAYLPDAIMKNPRTSARIQHLYTQFKNRGELELTAGEVTNYDYIVEDLLQYTSMFNVQAIGYDPHNSAYLCQRLENKYNMPVVEVKQLSGNLNEPSKHFQMLLYDGKIRYNSSLFEWCCMNAEVFVYKDGNIKIKKDTLTGENKVDPLVATVIGFAIAVIPDVDYDPFAAYRNVEMKTTSW